MTTPKPPRCLSRLEALLPDEGGYIDARLILQCDRDQGHRGQHRHAGPVTWTTPKEAKP
ncbi:hypothetical protein [Nocardia asiatica]|uniref:hypothetical protein n=1 Tax=Nocardia asiatica TaxID=209252 RepID=UPI0002FB0A8D|nr:hypothetical protein [Nocardia asiatica]